MEQGARKRRNRTGSQKENLERSKTRKNEMKELLAQTQGGGSEGGGTEGGGRAAQPAALRGYWVVDSQSLSA